MIKKTLTLLLVLSALVATGWAVLNRQYVKDWYIVKTTDVQPEAAAIGNNLSLTKNGSFLYEASQPEVLGAGEFNQACANVNKEKTIVLGCYSAQRLYVYNVTDERLNGVKEVTAAHELLHAVYERLAVADRKVLDAQLEQAANAITDERFQSTIEAYRSIDPSVVNNELHSILGTEITVLPEALEKHYAQYFKDRSQITRYAAQYQSQFIENENKIKSLDAQMATLKTRITELESLLSQLEAELNSRQEQLNTLRNRDVAAYNQGVPGFNDLVARYNSQVTNLKNLVNRYNSLLEERNAVVGAQADLSKQLDSAFQTR